MTWQPSSRREELLTVGVIPDRQIGLEIGALNNPIIRPQFGNVRFVDYTDTASLRIQHKDHRERVEGMVEVTYVWQGTGSLAEVIRTGELFDWVIASHVVEHVPNALGWFRGISEILRPGAILNLAIPDRRFTFDVSCPESTLGELVEADLLGFTHPSIRQMFNHCYYGRAIEPGQIWREAIDIATLQPLVGKIAPQLAYDQAIAVLNEGRYIDSHCWIVTPLSFLDLLRGACDLALFPFLPIAFATTEKGEFEFFMSLQKMAEDVDTQSRREQQLRALDRFRSEVREQQRIARLLSE